MNDQDTGLLYRYVLAAFPANARDPRTPDTWREILPADFTLAECRQAAVVVARRQPYCAASDLIAEVEAARRHDRDRARRAEDKARLEAAPAAVTARGGADPRPLREVIERLVAEHWKR